jgi:methionyl-tRNA formyltransferase
MLNDKTCRIYEARVVPDEWLVETLSTDIDFGTTTIGLYKTDGKKYLHFQCTDGILAIENLQLEGKKRMGIEEFLRGYRLLNS